MKEQLIELIETYAAAKLSGNSLLQQFAAKQVSAFLDGVELTPKAEQATEEEAEY